MNTISKRLFLSGLVILLIATGWLIYRSTIFHVVSTNPSTSAMDTETPFLDIHYSQLLASSKSLSVTSNPQIINSYVISGKSLDIVLDPPLNTTTKYSISVSGIINTKGKKLSEETFTFKPIYVSQLPNDQANALLKQQEADAKAQTIKNENPILLHLPYSTLNFSLSAKQLTPSLILSANLYVSGADENGGPAGIQSAINSDEQGVISFIESLGLNPNNYAIQYNDIESP